jgi:hypothetical protein
MTIDKNSFYARTMHTPDSPERAESRAALREISKALLPLHRQLIEQAISDFSSTYGVVERTTEMVQLLTDDPFFAWLKPLTSIIVDIDEMVRTDFTPADALAIADRLEKVFNDDQYIAALHRDVDVAMGHAAVRRALARLTAGNGR